MSIFWFNGLFQNKTIARFFKDNQASGEKKKLSEQVEQGGELRERELRGSAHVNVIVSIPWFHRGIGTPKGLTQRPSTDTKAEMWKDTTTTH